MKSNFENHRIAGLACLVLGATLGCGSVSPSNLSPMPSEDAGRFERATRYTEELIKKNQDAEKKALSRKRFVPPQG